MVEFAQEVCYTLGKVSQFLMQAGEKAYDIAAGVYGILDVAICHLAGFKADVSFFYLLHNHLF